MKKIFIVNRRPLQFYPFITLAGTAATTPKNERGASVNVGYSIENLLPSYKKFNLCSLQFLPRPYLLLILINNNPS